MKKYGLQLRIPPQQQQQQRRAVPSRPAPPPTALGFGAADDDDEDDVEKEIARQAAKNRALREVEEKHKKALEEDPSVFDYDGVYDEIKLKVARPIMQDQQERKPKYIEKLLEKAKERKMEQDIIYERKLVKERSKEDHLYEDKEKFVTGAYKKKLEEQEKWKAEERLRQLREEKEDATKGSVSDFYFNLEKNVAFGAQKVDGKRPKQHETSTEVAPQSERSPVESERSAAEKDHFATRGSDRDANASRASIEPDESLKPHDDVKTSGTAPPTSKGENASTNPAQIDQMIEGSYKRSQDAVAAARERYLARKRTRELQNM